MKWKHTYTKWLAIALPLQWLIYFGIGRFPKFVEQYYSQGLYPQIAKAMRFFTSSVRIPFAQIMLLLVTVLLLLYLVRNFKKRKTEEKSWRSFFGKMALQSLALLSVIYFLFMWLWGFNNYRQPVEQQLGIELVEFDTTLLQKFCEQTIAETNNLRANCNYQLQTAQELIEQSAAVYQQQEAFSHLNIAKTPFWPKGMAYIGISGIFSPFTGEPFLNTDRPWPTIPAVSCHEMAHQLGYASERDANFMAYKATRKNEDSCIQYSGQLMAMRYGLHALSIEDSIIYNKLLLTISPMVQTDLDEIKAYNDAHDSILGNLGNFSNNIFLKLSGQVGTESYAQVVELLVADYLAKP